MAKSKLAKLGLQWLTMALGMLALTVLSSFSIKSGPNGADARNILAAWGADNVTIDRAVRDYRMPQDIEWKPSRTGSSQSANVFGDPSKPGLYVQLLKRGPDDWSQPHSHPNDRYITVLAGTMKVGAGANFDKEHTVSMGPGSVIRDIANQVHYDGTGPEGLTIEIIGMGPSAFNRAEK